MKSSINICKFMVVLSMFFYTFTWQLEAQIYLPDIEPPYKPHDGSSQVPVLKIGSFVKDNVAYELPAFWMGNKRIGMRQFDGKYLIDRDQMLGIMVDERLVMSITFWGSAKGPTGFGYPFAKIKGDSDELIADTVTQTITYRKPYLLPDGKRAVFSYVLRPGTESKMILEWDMGIT